MLKKEKWWLKNRILIENNTKSLSSLLFFAATVTWLCPYSGVSNAAIRRRANAADAAERACAAQTLRQYAAGIWPYAGQAPTLFFAQKKSVGSKKLRQQSAGPSPAHIPGTDSALSRHHWPGDALPVFYLINSWSASEGLRRRAFLKPAKTGPNMREEAVRQPAGAFSSSAFCRKSTGACAAQARSAASAASSVRRGQK